MLYMENTQKNLGVSLYGDYLDFENLYKALHKIIGDEDEYRNFYSSQMRVLGLCYDIRHAMQGDRDYTFVENGINDDILKFNSFIAPKQNVYLKVNIFWPEMLYIQMVLNDFLQLYARKNSSAYVDIFKDQPNIWDNNIATVRLFQSQFKKCLKDTITKGRYGRLLSYMINDYTRFSGYLTQYLDLLNIKFVNLDKDKRLEKISVFGKRLVEKGKGYLDLEEQFELAAEEYNCSIFELRLNEEYPEDIEW
ncbi:MAG: DUF6904 family protein [Senegalia sp. (in: firmicutes)]|uniref:DUF6904 family protein n=1 Tax=Senegalia sp. (in: firmicutes) TaxID=1924098 RepID=UPI003F9CE560